MSGAGNDNANINGEKEEDKIAELLSSLILSYHNEHPGLYYERQYKYSWGFVAPCKKWKKRKTDFAILNKNKQPIMFIEVKSQTQGGTVDEKFSLVIAEHAAVALDKNNSVKCSIYYMEGYDGNDPIYYNAYKEVIKMYKDEDFIRKNIIWARNIQEFASNFKTLLDIYDR